MKSIVKILLVALVFGAYGCASVTTVDYNDSKMAVFSLNSLKSGTKTIPLSSLVEGCTFVQLETKDEAFFKPWFTTVTDKYIGIRQEGSKPYMLFDRSGKFLCPVGSIGNGPGEYSISLYDDIIDDKNGLIYLAPFAGNKIFVYNTSGHFVKEFVAPQRLQKPKMFLSDGILTVIHMAMKHENPNNPSTNAADAIAIQFDVNTGNVLKQLPPPEHLIVHNFDGEIWNTKNVAGAFDITFTNSDTLYHFDVKDNRILPYFAMTYDSSEKPYKQYFQLNNDLVFTLVFSKGLVATDLKGNTSSWIKVVNDYYGNLPAPTYIIHLRNGYWVHNLQPEQLMGDIEKRLAEGSCTENDKQTLNKMLSTLHEGTNNIVFFGKLKREVNTTVW